MLIVQSLSVYRGATTLLKDVNFRVSKSDIVTIMGPSGSGKSSLFRGWSAHCLLSFKLQANCGSTNGV